MTQIELYSHLKSIGMPLSYNHFNEVQKTPYLTYLFTYSNDFIADNNNYHKISNFQIELYTDKKDMASEALVEGKLQEIELPYRKMESYINDEKVYQITYLVTI